MDTPTLRHRLPKLARTLLAIVLASLLAVGFAACGDDSSDSSDGSSGGDSGQVTTSSTEPNPPEAIPLSEDARDAGAKACRDIDPEVALRRFTALARKKAADDVQTTRKRLLMQARQLRKAGAVGEAGIAPVAAALYAISQPRTERSGAYQGCFAEMAKAAQAKASGG